MAQKGNLAFKKCDYNSCERYAEEKADQCYWHKEVSNKNPSEKFESEDIPRDLSGAYLKGADFSGLDLHETVFHEANLTGIDLSNTNLNGAKFDQDRFVRVIFENSILLGANIDKTYFIDCVLDASHFTGSELSQSIFENTSMEKTNFKDSEFNECLFINCNMRNSILEDSNISGNTLEECDLTNAHLSYSNFENVKFIGAQLSGATLSNANLSGATDDNASHNDDNDQMSQIFDDAKPQSEYEPVDFSNANLFGANLSEASFQNPDFRNSNLIGADLREASLMNAQISGMQLTDKSLVERLESIDTILGSGNETDIRKAIDAIGILSTESPEFVTLFVEKILIAIESLDTPSLIVSAVRALCTAAMETKAEVPHADPIFAELIRNRSDFVALETIAATSPLLIESPNMFKQSISAIEKIASKTENNSLKLQCTQLLAVILYNSELDQEKQSYESELQNDISNIILDVQQIAAKSPSQNKAITEVTKILERVAEHRGELS